MVTVAINGDVATVSVSIDAAKIKNDVPVVLYRAAEEIRAAMNAPQKSDAEIDAEVQAEADKRKLARPVVTVK